MLFKFIWVAITALALYGCPGEEKKNGNGNDDEKELRLKANSGSATWDTDKVKFSATILQGTDPAEGVPVTFVIKCGTAAEVKVDAGKTNKQGVASASKAVTGVTDADTLKPCKVTANFGEGDAAKTGVVKAAEDTPAALKMGVVHEGVSWNAAPTACDLTKYLVYEMESDGSLLAGDQSSDNKTATSNWAASGSDKKILVLPKEATDAANTAKCAIGDKDIMGDTEAHSTVLPNGCSTSTCWSVDNQGEIDATGDANPTAPGSGTTERWIKKTGTGTSAKYVYHVVTTA